MGVVPEVYSKVTRDSVYISCHVSRLFERYQDTGNEHNDVALQSIRLSARILNPSDESCRLQIQEISIAIVKTQQSSIQLKEIGILTRKVSRFTLIHGTRSGSLP